MHEMKHIWRQKKPLKGSIQWRKRKLYITCSQGSLCMQSIGSINYEVVNMIHWQWMHMQPFVYWEWEEKINEKCIVDTSLRLLVHIQAVDQIWILYPKFIFVPLPVDAQMALTVHLNALYNRRMECKGFGSLRKASKKMELNIHFLIEVPLLPFPLINWEKIKLSFLFFHTNIIKGIK